MTLSEAMTWLKGRIFETEGEALAYVRGATEVAVTAVRGRLSLEGQTVNGSIIRMESPDFLVRASEIAAVAPPAAGDKILDGDNVYQVLSPDGTGSVWQWADWPNKTVYRIHTKQVAPES